MPSQTPSLENFLQHLQKTHLIFDFDETIAKMVLDWQGWKAGILKIMQKYDSDARFEEGIFAENTNRLAFSFGKAFVEETNQFSEQYERDKLEDLLPNPEIIDFIKNNYQQYQMFVYSSNSRQAILDGLKALQIESCFSKIVSKSEVYFLKPHPDGFYQIYDVDVDKSRYLMTGDSESDKGMAEAVGIDFFKVDYFSKK